MESTRNLEEIFSDGGFKYMAQPCDPHYSEGSERRIASSRLFWVTGGVQVQLGQLSEILSEKKCEIWVGV